MSQHQPELRRILVPILLKDRPRTFQRRLFAQTFIWWGDADPRPGGRGENSGCQLYRSDLEHDGSMEQIRNTLQGLTSRPKPIPAVSQQGELSPLQHAMSAFELPADDNARRNRSTAYDSDSLDRP